jgi:tRNA-specific 2-thiouridylase
MHYTVGQRKGLGIAGGEPLYVVRLDAERAEVVVGPRSALEIGDIVLEGLNWLGDLPESGWPSSGLEVAVKVRSTRPARPATLRQLDGICRAELETPEEGVAPGQACVIYDSTAPGARLLGGGVIATTYGRACTNLRERALAS